MKYLLDTHIWLWCLLEPERLDETIMQILEDRNNELFIISDNDMGNFDLGGKRKN